MAIEQIRDETVDFFRSPPRARAAVPAGVAAPEVETFSQFNVRQMSRVAVLTRDFARIRAAAPDEEDGLRQVLDAARQRAAEENADLVKWALRLFITHDPVGQRLPTPSLEAVAPQMLLPSRPRGAAAVAAERGAAADPETALDWYREDPWANQHHEHWHTVYPGTDGSRDREGELFLYMHEQMLARYDTERFTAGLPLTEPLADYRAPIRGGYDPGPPLRDQSGEPFGSRPAGKSMADVQGFEELEGWRDHIGAKLGEGWFDGADGADRLGSHAEASRASTWLRRRNGTYVGESLHNEGHDKLSQLSTSNRPGVMAFVQTAIRDPLFYRWHRHIDNFSYAWQQRQPAHRLDVDAPPVVIRKSPAENEVGGDSPDVMLALARDIPGSDQPAFDGQAWAEEFAGGAAWTTDIRSRPPSTDTLLTRIDSTTIEHDGGTTPIVYLRHEPFFYVFRFENRAAEDVPLTVRVFLAAEGLRADRRLWIEMDKFALERPATPGPNVVFRAGARSSVIRQSSMPPEPIASTGADVGSTSYCQCGWPYNLLLPRGTAAGMKFRLLVMLTDATIDTATGSACGSMSFCGMRNAVYPDTRPMGYPFDRDWAGGTIDEVIARQPNIATRTITIRCESNGPD